MDRGRQDETWECVWLCPAHLTSLYSNNVYSPNNIVCHGSEPILLIDHLSQTVTSGPPTSLLSIHMLLPFFFNGIITEDSS